MKDSRVNLVLVRIESSSMSAAVLVHIVQLLLFGDSRVDPRAGDNRGYEVACQRETLNVVQLLNSRVNPSAGDNRAIKRAVNMKMLGYSAIVMKILV
jgi:hypothetical protein